MEVPEVCIKTEEIFKEEFGVTHLAAELLGNKKHSEEAYVEELFGEAHDSSESEEAVNKTEKAIIGRNKKPALKIKQEEEKGLFNSTWKSTISDETNKVTMLWQYDHVSHENRDTGSGTRKLFCSDGGARVEVNKVNTG